ncbi:lysophosphatidylcholine acyltransferase isoform X2 [Planococcus citri]|uniref:lysophosphatidylcholine acyltransferase isoform X2 n=1 Tax=Planococcus citri TaxID=170843 RepID=UPI0031F7E9E0
MSDKLLLTTDMVASNDILNPFIHHLELTTTYDKIRTAVFTIIILPIRLAIISGVLILAWILACIGLYGLTEEDLTKKPITGWRRLVRKWICILGRSAYTAGGMHIEVKGRQVPRAEAPILVIAPHSTFLDAVIVYVTGFPSIIVRRESGMNPWFGKILNFTQPIYVGRDDPDSRQKTIQDIIDRTTSKEDWAQVLIFPEGTCTNRSCLITFKPGAFYPGVPVQPVLIRYPNKLDTVTWTWDGPGALKLLWLTLTRAHSKCEIEFLPVYTPNEEEKKDPKLFAHNVRNVMAKALGIPTSDYTYEDCRLVKKAKELQLFQNSQLIHTQKLRIRLGITRRKVELQYLTANQNIFKPDQRQFLNKQQFVEFLGIHDHGDHELEELFQIYSIHENGDTFIDLQKYLLAVLLIEKSTSRNDMVHLAFGWLSNSVDKKWFQYIMSLVHGMSYDHAETIFNEITLKEKSTIKYDEYLTHTRMYPETIEDNNNQSTVYIHKKDN